MRKKISKLALFVFLAPSILIYLLIYLYPTLRTVLMSFFSMKTLTVNMSEWTFVGIENYVKLFESSLFLQSVWNLFKIWLWGGIIVLITAIMFAAILTSGIKGKKFFRSVIYLPNVVSAVALGTMWIQYVFNSKYGLFNKIFSFLGIDALANFQWTALENLFLSMLIAYCFGMVGYFMLMFMAGIERIPADYYEAAYLEGCTGIQSFFFITLPLLTGIIKTTLVLWTVRSLGFFIWSQIFSPLLPDNQTITPMVYMYQIVFGTEFQVDGAPGVGAAVGVLMVIVTVLMFGLSNLLFKEAVEEF